MIRSSLLHAILLLAIQVGGFAEVAVSQDKLSPIQQDEKATELHSVDGVIVSAGIRPDYPFDRSDSEVFRSVIESQLRRNGIQVFEDYIYSDSKGSQIDIARLRLYVEAAEMKFKDGSLTGHLVYSIELNVVETVEPSRYKYDSVFLFRDAHIPPTTAIIWGNSRFGYIATEAARAKFKETISELVELFMSDLATQNSKSTEDWVDERYRERFLKADSAK